MLLAVAASLGRKLASRNRRWLLHMTVELLVCDRETSLPVWIAYEIVRGVFH